MSTRGKGPNQQKILKLISDGKPRTCREIAQELGMDSARVHQKVQQLHSRADGHSPYAMKSLMDPNGEIGELKARKWVITEAGRKVIE